MVTRGQLSDEGGGTGGGNSKGGPLETPGQAEGTVRGGPLETPGEAEGTVRGSSGDSGTGGGNSKGVLWRLRDRRREQ